MPCSAQSNLCNGIQSTFFLLLRVCVHVNASPRNRSSIRIHEKLLEKCCFYCIVTCPKSVFRLVVCNVEPSKYMFSLTIFWRTTWNDDLLRLMPTKLKRVNEKSNATISRWNVLRTSINVRYFFSHSSLPFFMLMTKLPFAVSNRKDKKKLHQKLKV